MNILFPIIILQEKISDTVLTKEALYRCISTIVKEFYIYDKIIYSDVDIVVMKDISVLYNIDLENNYLASFKTPRFLSYETEHLDKKIRKTYFGGGFG